VDLLVIAFHQLHDQGAVFDPMYGGDVGMIQGGEHFSLALETGES
jgi:hypothetical protein